MSSKMLIDSSHPEETRVVVTKGNRLEEFDFESQHKRQIRGNIYLAKVTRVEPSLQAAFVDYGGNRHGFLAFSEIHPDYYQIPQADRQALLDEEAALAEAEDNDDDLEALEEEKGDRRRDRGGRRSRRSRRGRKKSAAVPEAEPVAMDAILAALEENDDENGEADEVVIAAAVDSDNVISEPVDTETSEKTVEEPDASDDDDQEASLSADEIPDEGFDDNESDEVIDVSRARKRVSRRHYKIQEVIKRRQIILVQVVKEERGNKGAALTTYMSLAGRYSVLMPNTARGGGISRKITNLSDRKRLKDIVRELEVPKGMGVILRTAGANRTKADIHRDYEYLMRLWDNVRDLTLRSSAPTLVYEEGNLIKRSIRDLFNPDISEIVVSGADGYREAKDFMRMLMPSHAKIVQPWRDAQPLLARTGMESQLDKLIQPQVTLKSGGYIIINQTEALVAIDVNSGKSTREHSIEDTALATNLEAAEEVARQLRLRDLAGLIVVDFIDMEENRNNRAVEKKLKDCLKSDRARIQVGRISNFGLLEMSRQRMRASVLESTMTECSHCGGTGYVRSPQSIALHILRSVEEYLLRNGRNDITVRTATQTALYLLNKKRETLTEMEQRFGLSILVEADESVGTELFAIDKGEPARGKRNTNASKAVSFDELDDPEQVAIDEAAYQAFLESEGAQGDASVSSDDDEDQPSRKKRRRRRRKGRGDGDSEQENGSVEASEDSSDEEQGGKKRRRSRGRRGGKNRRNRRDRFIPAAEPVGPFADMIAAEAAKEAEEKAVQESPVEEAAVEPVEENVSPSETVSSEVTTQDTVIAEEVEAASVAPEADPGDAAEASPDQVVEDAPTETGDETQAPARKRATAATLDLDAEPVVVSQSDEEPKPKRGGWWSRKSFF